MKTLNQVKWTFKQELIVVIDSWREDNVWFVTFEVQKDRRAAIPKKPYILRKENDNNLNGLIVIDLNDDFSAKLVFMENKSRALGPTHPAFIRDEVRLIWEDLERKGFKRV